MVDQFPAQPHRGLAVRASFSAPAGGWLRVSGASGLDHHHGPGFSANGDQPGCSSDRSPPVRSVPQRLDQSRGGFTEFLVEHTHLPKANIVSFVDEVNRQFLAQFQQINNNLVKLSGQITGTAVTISLTIVQSSLNWLLNAVIIMVLSFYMTLDGKRLMGSLMRFLPETWASELAAFNASVSRSFGGYIRGQLLLGLIYALMTYITLIVFHISFAVALAVFAGVMMLIPFIGTYLAIIPPLVVAGLQATNASR